MVLVLYGYSSCHWCSDRLLSYMCARLVRYRMLKIHLAIIADSIGCCRIDVRLIRCRILKIHSIIAESIRCCHMCGRCIRSRLPQIRGDSYHRISDWSSWLCDLYGSKASYGLGHSSRCPDLPFFVRRSCTV